MSDVANPTLSLIEDLIKKGLWDVLVRAKLEALFIAAPWLNIWPLRQITTGLAQLVTDDLFNEFRKWVDVTALPIINLELRKKFDQAAVTLAVIAHEKGIESPEFLNARETAHEAFARFVRYGGSASQ
jgi:hypothetical protein